MREKRGWGVHPLPQKSTVKGNCHAARYLFTTEITDGHAVLRGAEMPTTWPGSCGRMGEHRNPLRWQRHQGIPAPLPVLEKDLVELAVKWRVS